MIKKLMKSIREYKKDSLLSPAMVTLEVIMEVIIPMLMARLIDYGIQAQNLGYIWKMGILLAVTAMISLMFGVLSGKFAARASAGFAKNLRKDMYYNVQNFSFSNIDKFSTASNASDNGRYQRAECISDDHSYGGSCTDHADFFYVYGISGKFRDGSDFPGSSSDPWYRTVFDHDTCTSSI